MNASLLHKDYAKQNSHYSKLFGIYGGGSFIGCFGTSFTKNLGLQEVSETPNFFVSSKNKRFSREHRIYVWVSDEGIWIRNNSVADAGRSISGPPASPCDPTI